MRVFGACAVLLAAMLGGCEEGKISVLVPYENELYVVKAESSLWLGRFSGELKLKDGKTFTIVEPGRLAIVSVSQGKVERLGRIESCLGDAPVHIVVWSGETWVAQRNKYCRTLGGKS